MRILNLIIKVSFLDEIIAGRKKKETREIRPTNVNQYVDFKPNGLFDKCKEYDAIQFWGGYNKDRKGALVEVLGSELIVFKDEMGRDLTYEVAGEKYVQCQIEYVLGKVLKT